ncbi:MAG: SUF system NifU family Fe-S cluster assembly protein [Xanthomonadales bacterium]|nr:SUF system NifU family Fe-S cluster assembly protein [Xanthomonadales bacterium]
MVLDQLYQQAVLAHNREPKNAFVMTTATHSALGNNALCSDALQVYLEVFDDEIMRASFSGDACAIATASASIMTEWLNGRSTDEARAGAVAFENMLFGRPFDRDFIGESVLLQAVASFPSRIKSASLCWHAMIAALDGVAEISTE